jgi:methylamine--corrinoid protein Co-methyltransferase
VWELWRRAETGPLCPEREFDLKRFYPAVKRLVKEYDITYDPETVIPTDNTLIDDVFKAGIDLLTEVGVLCPDTEKIIQLEEREVKESLATLSGEMTVGEGKDACLLKHRKMEDHEPARVFAGPSGNPISEEMAIPIYQSCAQEPTVDLLMYGTPTTIAGMVSKDGSPMEMYAEVANVRWLREAARRAGRPGMFIIGSGAVGVAPAILASLVENGYRKTDGIQLAGLPQLKIPYFELCKAEFCIEYGCRGWVTSPAYIGGLPGGPEAAAVTEVAECIAANLVFRTPWVCVDIHDLLYPPGTSRRDVMSMVNLVTAALAKHTKLIVSTLCDRVYAGCCTDMAFYEFAVAALGAAVAGGDPMSGCCREGRYTDYVTGMEGRCTGEIAKSVTGMRRVDANDIAKAILAKYEDRLPPKGKPPIGKEFRECYNPKTVTPNKEYVELYGKIKKELEDMGISYKF